MFEDDVFIENTRLVGGSKMQDLNLRADIVLIMSRGSPGQWFSETEYVSIRHLCGNKGHTAQIIYRSVKSYSPYLSQGYLPESERNSATGVGTRLLRFNSPSLYIYICLIK